MNPRVWHILKSSQFSKIYFLFSVAMYIVKKVTFRINDNYKIVSLSNIFSIFNATFWWNMLVLIFRLITTKCDCDCFKKIGPAIFDVPNNVLGLVYSQTLLW